MSPSPPVWVFGYGSLMWRPGFEYADSKIGHITGYKRRFWQGNDVHRGTAEKLGRVVTLVDADESEKTWGRAFQMSDEQTCREYLDNREATLGGYATRIVTFVPADAKEEPFPVLVYIALSCNSLFLGPAKYPQMAAEIAESAGVCGPNVEYLTRLAQFMRSYIPGAYDHHLFTLEVHVRRYLEAKNDTKLLKYFDDVLELDLELLKIDTNARTISSSASDANGERTDDNSVCNANYEHNNANTNSNSNNNNNNNHNNLNNNNNEHNGESAATVRATSKKYHYTDFVPHRKLRCVDK